MKLWKVLQFEIGYQLSRRSTWFYFVIVLGLAFRMASEVFLDNARKGGYLFNGPFSVAAVVLIGGMIGLLVTAALAGDAATRDMSERMEPLVYTTSVTRAQYLFGRFLGAFAVNLLLLLALPIGLALVMAMPGLEPEVLGPFKLGAYLGPYLLLSVPNAFVATAILFALAALTRTALSSFIGATLLFITSFLCNELIAKHLGRWELAKHLDPAGFSVMAEFSRSWTPVEKSTRMLSLDGSMLSNRLVWIAIALAALAVTHRFFRFAHHASRSARKRAAAVEPGEKGALIARSAPVSAPVVARPFSRSTRIHQTLAIAMRSVREVVTSWGALAFVVIAAIVFASGPELMEHMGVPIYPTTERIVSRLASPGDIVGFIAAFLTVFYAGELIWRERDAGMSEITNTAPVPNAVLFTGKLLGLVLVLLMLQSLLLFGGMLTQVRLGYFNFELPLYLRMMGLQSLDYVLFAALAFAVHVIVNQKYTGHLLLILIFALSKFPREVGIEHNLLVFGSDPGWSYSDMAGFGPGLTGVLWFKFLWTSVALLLAFIARALWVRGSERGLAARLRAARSRLSGPALASVTGALIVSVLVGGFIYYNTNVLNAYVTDDERVARRAEYERRHGRHANVPQPQVAATSLRVELYPERSEAEIRGTYRLVNRLRAPIDTIHLATASSVENGAVRMNRPFEPGAMDDDLGHRIYRLKQPLHPGEAMELSFELRFDPRGFSNNGVADAVVANGTNLESSLLPAIGYQRERELSGVADRRMHKLPPKPPMTPLDDVAARFDPRRAEQIEFEAIVGTSHDQVALAPGRLQRSWSEKGRRYFHYKTEQPISNGFAIYSADYRLHDAVWKAPAGAGHDVAIQIVHHPGHAWEVERMARSIQRSLDYMTRLFGPYPHRQIRVVEAPGAGIGLHADAINIRYNEGFSLLKPEDDWRKIDFPFGVVAHEVAHQWWGHQVVPAEVEGAAVLSESLAWYSAINIVEKEYGADHLRRYMDVMRDAYLSPRARADVPLMRASDWYSGYRKGLFAMYALREYVGEEPVNLALRRMIDKYPPGTLPLPTTRQLLAELQSVTPEPLRYLLTDLFEVNTFWEFTTKEAKAQKTADGRWNVTLDVKARKLSVDEANKERELPMNDLVEIGVFTRDENGGLGKALYLQKHRIRAGGHKITVTVASEPALAGIDPRNLLIDTNVRDNRVVVATN